MGDWESIRVPKHIHARVKRNAERLNTKMWRLVADAIEGKMEVKYSRLMDLEDELIGMTDLCKVLLVRSRKLHLKNWETGDIVHKMTITMADELEKWEVSKGSQILGGKE